MNKYVSTYRQRFLVVLVAFILVSILAWNFALKKSFIIRNKNIALKEQIEKAHNAPQKIKALEKNFTVNDSKLGTDIDNGDGQYDYLLEKIGSFCSNQELTITDFKRAEDIVDNSIGVEFIPFEVQGEYVNIMQLIYYIERESNLGRVSHVHFFLEEEKRIKKTFLKAEILISKIKLS